MSTILPLIMLWISVDCGLVYVVFLLLAHPPHVLLLLAYPPHVLLLLAHPPHVLLLRRLIRGLAGQLLVHTLGRGPRVAPYPPLTNKAFAKSLYISIVGI